MHFKINNVFLVQHWGKIIVTIILIKKLKSKVYKTINKITNVTLYNITLNNVIMNSNFIKLQMTDRPINQSNFIFPRSHALSIINAQKHLSNFFTFRSQEPSRRSWKHFTPEFLNYLIYQTFFYFPLICLQIYFLFDVVFSSWFLDFLFCLRILLVTSPWHST